MNNSITSVESHKVIPVWDQSPLRQDVSGGSEVTVGHSDQDRQIHYPTGFLFRTGRKCLPFVGRSYDFRDDGVVGLWTRHFEEFRFYCATDICMMFRHDLELTCYLALESHFVTLILKIYGMHHCTNLDFAVPVNTAQRSGAYSRATL